MTCCSNVLEDWMYSYNILSCRMNDHLYHECEAWWCPWDYATFKTCPSLATVDSKTLTEKKSKIKKQWLKYYARSQMKSYVSVLVALWLLHPQVLLLGDWISFMLKRNEVFKGSNGGKNRWRTDDLTIVWVGHKRTFWGTGSIYFNQG